MRFLFGKIFATAAVAAALGFAAAGAQAAPVTIVSGAGDESCNDAACVLITPHSAWQPNDPLFLGNPTTAQWISFGDTGITPPNQAAVPHGPTPQLIYKLTFDADALSDITTKVWADDTAKIFVDGVALNTPDIDPSHNSTCQNPNAQTPSCVTGEQYSGSLGDFFFGHVLEIDVWQLGTGATNAVNPFGLLYAGQIEVSAVPEPTTMALLGTALGGLAFGARRRKSAGKAA